MIPYATTLADITSGDWSLMLDSTAALPSVGLSTGLGNVVQGLADVDQCIRIICTTPKGSDPFRPTFACDLFNWLDKPIDLATAHIVRDVFEAIIIWEPRATVLSVNVAPVLTGAQAGAQMTVSVTWQINLGGAPSARVTTVITPPTTVPQGQN